MLWNILVQFIFRLTFGLSAAMAATSPRLVTAGYYRTHLWVVLGLCTFAAVAIASGEAGHPARGSLFQLAVMTSVTSYVASVIWLYERQSVGRLALIVLAGVCLTGAFLAGGGRHPEAESLAPNWLRFTDVVSSGLLLGFVIAAMFLGHWYLNNPGMQLAPLRRLIVGIIALTLIRSILCGWGLGQELTEQPVHQAFWWTLLGIRWIAGLLGTLLLGGMTWQTLKIPNTQSATGILYVAVITVFLGELSSQFLTSSAAFPI